MDRELDDIFVRLCADESGAMRDLYRVAGPRVYGALCRILPGEEACEAAMRETFIRVWRRRHERAGVHSGHLEWITAIAHRQALERRKVADSAASAPATDGAAYPWREQLRTDTPETAHFATLAEGDFILLASAYLEGRTLQDLARDEDAAPDRISERLRQAVAAIREPKS